MKLLLDTHAFLWAMAGAGLSERAASAFLDIENDLYFSAASYWEICIKISIGKLVLSDGWEERIERFIELNRIQWLPIERSHSQAIIRLPMIHRDPFDRLLIAQAQSEDMAILTRDEHIRQYNIPTIW